MTNAGCNMLPPSEDEAQRNTCNLNCRPCCGPLAGMADKQMAGNSCTSYDGLQKGDAGAGCAPDMMYCFPEGPESANKTCAGPRSPQPCAAGLSCVTTGSPSKPYECRGMPCNVFIQCLSVTKPNPSGLNEYCSPPTTTLCLGGGAGQSYFCSSKDTTMDCKPGLQCTGGVCKLPAPCTDASACFSMNSSGGGVKRGLNQSCNNQVMYSPCYNETGGIFSCDTTTKDMNDPMHCADSLVCIANGTANDIAQGSQQGTCKALCNSGPTPVCSSSEICLGTGNTCNMNTCKCTGPTCGKYGPEAGEECDDGNYVNTDACTQCKNATCGDGYLRTDITNSATPGYEKCDDGNTTNGDGCSSSCQKESLIPTTTVLTAVPSSSANVGQNVTFTATVSPSAAGGSVTFKDGSSPLATVSLNGGIATYSSSTLAAGSHSITAVYSGNTTYATSSSTLSYTINKISTSTVVTSSLNPSLVGQSVTFTATITPSSITGNVTFKDGSNILANGSSVAISAGKATYTTTALAAGTHPITAIYNGDPTYAASTSPQLNQVVNGTSSASASNSNSSDASSGNSATSASSTTSLSGSTPSGTSTPSSSASSSAASSTSSVCTLSLQQTMDAFRTTNKITYQFTESNGNVTFNNQTGCKTTISITTYKIISFTPALQTLFTSPSVTLQPGSTSVDVDTPQNCNYQYDFWYGTSGYPQTIEGSGVTSYPTLLAGKVVSNGGLCTDSGDCGDSKDNEKDDMADKADVDCYADGSMRPEMYDASRKESTPALPVVNCPAGNTVKFTSMQIAPIFDSILLDNDASGKVPAPGYKGTVFDDKTVSLNLQPGDKVFVMGFAADTGKGTVHYTDDFLTLSGPHRTADTVYNDASCQFVRRSEVPIDVTSMLVKGDETKAFTASLRATFKDYCRGYENHSTYFANIARCVPASSSSVSTRSSSSATAVTGNSSSLGSAGPVPTCHGKPATIYLDGTGKLVGGNAQSGFVNGGLIVHATSANDVIVGTSGNDTIWGGNGNDTICGLAGDDNIWGEDGDDLIDGGDGADAFHGSKGDDTLYGGAAADTIYGDEGQDHIYGEDGGDTIAAGDDGDFVCGGNDGDTIQDAAPVTPGRNIFCGGPGNDTINGGGDNDKLDGGIGANTVSGLGGADICKNGPTFNQCEDTTSNIPECNDCNGISSGASSSLQSSSRSSSFSSGVAVSTSSSLTSRSTSSTVSSSRSSSSSGFSTPVFSQGSSTTTITQLPFPPTAAVCGNMALESGEGCDDGNRYSQDGCSGSCYLEPGVYPFCGDGIITQGEECESGSQCENCRWIFSASSVSYVTTITPPNLIGCTPETGCDGGYRCINNFCLPLPADLDGGTYAQQVAQQNGQATSAVGSNMLCGNGTTEAGEQCDDGVRNSNLSNARCRIDCRLGTCGDQIIDTSYENCDDGNVRSGDGCSSLCQSERQAPAVLPANVIQLPLQPGATVAQQTVNGVSTTRGQLVQNSNGQTVYSLAGLPQTTQSGPAALAIMAAGASAGYSWMKRKKK